MNLLPTSLAYPAAVIALFVVSSLPATVTADSQPGSPEIRATDEERAAAVEHRRNLTRAGWRLIWKENFTGREIRDNNWSHEVNCAGGGNNELQCYTERPENSFVKDGMLHIVAKEEQFSGPGLDDDHPDYDPDDMSRTQPYTSARLRSKHKFDFTYGRVEVRAKVPGGQGMWPAIWMLPTDWVYGGWPSSGEIDIMEAVNLGVWPDEVHGTNHYGLAWPQWENHGQTLEMEVNPADDFHVYAIEWEADEIRWYVDGKHYQTQTSEGWYNYVWKGQEEGFQVANPRAPFDQDFHLILNVATGGDWPGTPDTGWPEDRKMLVDYVHVYQCRQPGAGPGQGEEGYTGAGCGTIDETVEVNSDAGAPGVNAWSMFSEGPETLSFEVDGNPIDNTLVAGLWELVEGTVFQQVVDLGGDHGQVWDILFNGTGNVFLGSADMSDEEALDDGFQLAGGSGWTKYGELEFDIFVADASADSQLVVKLDSGWPDAGEVIIDMPAPGEWHHVAISVADLLANPIPDGGGIDLSRILNVFVLEHRGVYASVQVDNIELQCAVNTEPESWQLDQTCSLEPRAATVVPTGDVLDIYIDAVTDWNVFDCCGGASIAEISLEGNHVLEFTYDGDPGTNTVTFFQPPAPLDLSGFAGGTVEFDMFVVSQPTNPATNPWLIKVDCDSGCSTGDTPITQSAEGVLPATGVWQHYTFSLDALVGQGLDLGKVSALVVFPAWGNQDNAVFHLDNVILRKAGGGGTDGELVTNGSFDNGIDGWSGGTVVSEDGNNVYQADVAVPGNPWDVNLSQTMTLVPDETYVLSFRAKASVGRSIIAGLGLYHEPWTNLSETVALSTDWQSFSFVITTTGFGDDNSRVLFDLGAEAGTVYIDDVSVKVQDSDGGDGTAGIIDFEPGGLGDFWSWAVFENDDNPPLEIVSNPDTSGLNPSATVAQFTARSTGQPWAGTETFDIETFTLDASNSTVKIMVYKSVVSDVGIKFAIADGGAQPEIKVANTLVNEWEELTFDFAPYIGRFETIDITTLIVFPDFDLSGRTTDTVNYFDNISFSAIDDGGGDGGTAPAEAAPTPTEAAANVISIFSDAYQNISGVDFNPNWGQATVVTTESIVGNDTLKYADLNYQGTGLFR